MAVIPEASPYFVAAEAVTALGDGLAATFTALLEGRTGVVPVTEFDASPYRTDAAARLPARSEAAPEGSWHVVTPHGTILERVTRAAHASARLSDLPGEAIGLFVALGMVDSDPAAVEPAIAASRDDAGAFELARFFGGGFRSIHPHWPLQMLNNVVVGQISAGLSLRGDNLVLACEADAGARALAEAKQAIESGAALAAVVAGISEAVSPAAMLRASLRGTPGLVLGEGGAALVLESAASVEARGALPVGRLTGTGFAFGASDVGAGPSAAAIERAAREALRDAGRSSEDVGVLLVEGAGAEEAEARRSLFGRRTDIAVVAPAVALGHLLAGAPAVATAIALAILSTGEAPSMAHGKPRAVREGSVAIVLASGTGGGAAALVVERAP
jgi:3-oxoacyl-(acyl-carrier-protein) synthase